MRHVEHITYDRCHHLDRTKCVTRSFEIFNLKKGCFQKISVCADLASILYKQFLTEDYNIHYSAYCKLLEKIVADSTDYCVEDFSWFNNPKEIKGEFTYCISKRPWIHSITNIREVTEFFLGGDGHRHYQFYDLWDSYIVALTRYCEYQLKYKKYKYQHDQLTSILRRLNKCSSWELEENLKELFIIILQLKINKSIQYETSK